MSRTIPGILRRSRKRSRRARPIRWRFRPRRSSGSFSISARRSAACARRWCRATRGTRRSKWSTRCLVRAARATGSSSMGEGWRTLRVPASSANLGPGFDAMGLALGIYLQCRFRPAPALSIRATGRDAGLISTGSDNLIWQTALEVANGTLAPIELEIENGIPIGKGLGSSAAALTAGVVIADEVLGLGWPPQKVLDEAARIEG